MVATKSTPYFQEKMNFNPSDLMDEGCTTPLMSGNAFSVGEGTTEDMINESAEGDIEWELQHIKSFDNVKQLDLLRREIGHIVDHGLFPSEGWYDERYEHIDLYSQLSWVETANRFHDKDQYIHDTSLQTMQLLDELIEERGTRPNFNLLTYHRVINNIYNIWNYYSQTYMGNEDDPDIMDLIEGMTFLCK